jgi:hypothetical protein
MTVAPLPARALATARSMRASSPSRSRRSAATGGGSIRVGESVLVCRIVREPPLLQMLDAGL